MESGLFSIGDRNYSHSYELLNDMVAKGCGFLFRARESTHFTIIKHNQVDAEAQREGCYLDAVAILGGSGSTKTVELRLICFQ